ncbi:MAG: hypothetical protein KME54_06530 [Tolypothrix brevis GSE-NOS-MK-07-07A]|nr:hypothetical protein [Tolypothrix brevis GSE-NOS-MK-07-07A]
MNDRKFSGNNKPSRFLGSPKAVEKEGLCKFMFEFSITNSPYPVPPSPDKRLVGILPSCRSQLLTTPLD